MKWSGLLLSLPQLNLSTEHWKTKSDLFYFELIVLRQLMLRNFSYASMHQDILRDSREMCNKIRLTMTSGFVVTNHSYSGKA